MTSHDMQVLNIHSTADEQSSWSITQHSNDLDLDPMTFICELDPDIPDVQIRTSYVKAFKIYRLTGRQTNRQTRSKLYTTPLHGWSMKLKSFMLSSQEIAHAYSTSPRASLYTPVLTNTTRQLLSESNSTSAARQVALNL